jgi:FKBP-type peptidyl-prolyl cis-trans isomerase FkpA
MNLWLKLQKWRFLPLFACIAFFTNCRNSESEQQQIDPEQLKESLIKINKTLAHEEALAIDNYIARRGLKMERTGTGLRYMIIKPGKGAFAKAGMRATVNYRIELLDGTFCYSSDSLGPQSFVVDQDQIESGIHEGIKLLSKGAKAKFILPSHLAHGLLGDQDKIPAKSSVVYDIEVIDLTHTP